MILGLSVSKDKIDSKKFYKQLIENNIHNLDTKENLDIAEKILQKEFNKNYLSEQQIKEFFEIGKKEEINKEKIAKKQAKENKIFLYIILSIVAIFLLVKIGTAATKPNWNDLSDKEKQEAEWAYEVKEFIDDYKKDNG